MAGKKQVGNPYGKEMDRQTISRLGDHLAATGAKSIERENVDPRYWTAAYRVNMESSWEELGSALQNAAEDDALIKMVGEDRGCQIIAEFAFGNTMKRREAIYDFASLSAATDIAIALSQAEFKTDEWAMKYKDSLVVALIFYFR